MDISYYDGSRFDSTNFTQCVPMEEIVKSMPYLVMKSDALQLAQMCLLIGLFIGATVTYFIMKEIERRKYGS